MHVGETRFAQSQNIKKARLVFITPGDMRAGCVFFHRYAYWRRLAKAP